MTPAAKSKWCVYLMQRGNWWRVGRSQLYTTWGLGVKQRLMTEDGEAAWILSLHDTKEEAVAYAERNGIAYTLVESEVRKPVHKAYADNFKFGRIGSWTH